MKEITFSNHALYQMKERNIPRTLVLRSFESPNRLTRQSDRRKRIIKLLSRNRKKYALVVVYQEMRSVKNVITVFMSSKITKYLQN